jgi:hypothetical protein
MRLQEFLSDVDQNVYLRLFIPDDRLQAEQLRSLLEVLERYLRQVECQAFSVDSQKSEKGTIYLFRSDSKVNSADTLKEAFERFNSFMEMCGDDPNRAESLLVTRGIPESDVPFIVQRYSRDYRRLIIDTRHEFERKTLALRQNLESELIDLRDGPAITWSSETLPSLLGVAATGSNIAINVGSVSVVNSTRVRNEIDQIVNGSVSYNENDKRLLELVSQFADQLGALQCRSDLDQLKDSSTSEVTRQNAKQRLIAFLSKVGHKTGEIAQNVATEALKRYVDSLFKPT